MHIGGMDTEVIVWDVLGEQGLFRLRGHRGAITCVAWMERGGRRVMVTSSKVRDAM